MAKAPFGRGSSSHSFSDESSGESLVTPISPGDDDQWGFDAIDDPGTSYRCISESCMRIFQRDVRIMMKAVTEYDFPAGIWKLLVMDSEGLRLEKLASARQLREANDAGMAPIADAARKKLANIATVQPRVMLQPPVQTLKDFMEKTWGYYPISYDGLLHVSFTTLRHQIDHCNIITTMSTLEKSTAIMIAACQSWQMVMADLDLLRKLADDLCLDDERKFDTKIGGVGVSEVVEKVSEVCLHFSGMTIEDDLCIGKPADIEENDADLALAMMAFATFMEPVVRRQQRYSVPSARESLEKIISMVKSRFPERLPKEMRDMMNLAPELEAVIVDWNLTAGELMGKLEQWLIEIG